MQQNYKNYVKYIIVGIYVSPNCIDDTSKKKVPIRVSNN